MIENIEIDEADLLPQRRTTLAKAKKIAEIERGVKIMKKKRKLLKEVLEFRMVTLQNELPDHGFEDAKLVAD